MTPYIMLDVNSLLAGGTGGSKGAVAGRLIARGSSTPAHCDRDTVTNDDHDDGD